MWHKAYVFKVHIPYQPQTSLCSHSVRGLTLRCLKVKNKSCKDYIIQPWYRFSNVVSHRFLEDKLDLVWLRMHLNTALPSSR